MGVEQHRLIIVGSLHENIDLVNRAKERGYYTIVCDGNKDGGAKRIADKSYDIDIYDVDSFAEICASENADGIIGSFSDVVFEQITKVAAKANLKWYATPDILKYYRNKAEQKDLLRKIGIRSPRYVLKNDADFYQKVSKMSFPVVAKPVSGWGSKDILVFDSFAELKSFFVEKANDSDVDYEIEEYIDAFEYNAISWVINGNLSVLGIADRERNPRIKNEIQALNRVVYPSFIYGALKDKVHNLLQDFVNHTGQKDGPVSMQFFYKNGEIVVCEIAGRVLAHEYKLINYCGGSDIVDLLLDYVYDEKTVPIKSIKSDSSACGIYFLCDRGSFIKDASVARKVLDNMCVKDALWFCDEGKIFDNSYPYYLRCYLKAGSRNELDKVSQEIFDNMRVTNDNGKNVLIPFYTENRGKNK